MFNLLRYEDAISRNCEVKKLAAVSMDYVLWRILEGVWCRGLSSSPDVASRLRYVCCIQDKSSALILATPDTFDCLIMRMESEGEWNSVILIFL